MKNISCHSEYVIFDLDDTLISTKKRHFTIYTDFLLLFSFTPLNFQDYLKKRNEGLNNREIISLHSIDLTTSFEDFWTKRIEDWDYLKLDECIVDTTLLAEFKSLTETFFILLSLRSNEQTANQQFRSLPFANLFDEAVFLKHSSRDNPKKRWIQKFKKCDKIILFIGDSETDAEAAINNKISFAGVSTGWKNLNSEPIFENINDALRKITNEYQAKT